MRVLTPKTCEDCARPFTKRNAADTAKARFCSKSCANRATAARSGVVLRLKVEERVRPLAVRMVDHVVPPIEPDGCSGWSGATVNGYGQIQRGRRGEGLALAHRVAWELNEGPIPDGLDVLHHCDNPPCTVRAHLFLGTNADNIADRLAKGRPGLRREHCRLGEDHHNARLTEAAVRHGRTLRAQGATWRALGDLFGVAPQTIHDALTGRTWTHVT